MKVLLTDLCIFPDLRKKIFPFLKVISGHLGWVRCIAVEPGNQWFVTGSADRTIKVRGWKKLLTNNSSVSPPSHFKMSLAPGNNVLVTVHIMLCTELQNFFFLIT